MSEERKSIGAGKISKVPNKRLRLTIGDGAVNTKHIADGAITSQKISPDAIEYITADVQNQIDSIQIGGWAISQSFGNNEHIGVSQRTLTDAFNRIWNKFEEITGESLQGIRMTVTPDYFISESECTVHIVADSVGSYGKFEHIVILANGSKVVDAINTNHLEHDMVITDTTEITCVARILGNTYTKSRIVTKYFPFFIGSATRWEDVIQEKYTRPFNGSIKGNYDIDVEHTNDRMYIVIPASYNSEFNRADMNGFEIPFRIIDNNQFIIRESRNIYVKGIYNIDIV